VNVKGRKEEQRCKNMYVNTGVPVIDLNIVDRDTRGPMALDLALPAPREPSKIRRAVLLALPVPRAQILTTSVLPGNLTSDAGFFPTLHVRVLMSRMLTLYGSCAGGHEHKHARGSIHRESTHTHAHTHTHTHTHTDMRTRLRTSAHYRFEFECSFACVRAVRACARHSSSVTGPVLVSLPLSVRNCSALFDAPRTDAGAPYSPSCFLCS